MKKKNNILYLGNIPTHHPHSIGGATRLTENILNYLRKDGRINLEFLQVRRHWRPKWQIIDYFFLGVKLPFLLRKYDKILITSTGEFTNFMLPYLVFWTRMFNKPLYYHMIGGVYHKNLEKWPSFYRKIIFKALLQTKILWVETKEMIAYFKAHGIDQVQWMPNSRYRKNQAFMPKPFQKKLVFISQVSHIKGIDILLEAFKELPDMELDIYGPLIDYRQENFQHLKNIHYKGILDQDEVDEKLQEYDFLILPTSHGEGYPGIIIESFAAGVPVITTHAGAIAEIIEHNVNGFLLDDKHKAKQLVHLLRKMNEPERNRLALGAYQSFDRFDAHKNFDKIARELMK